MRDGDEYASQQGDNEPLPVPSLPGASDDQRFIVDETEQLTHEGSGVIQNAWLIGR